MSANIENTFSRERIAEFEAYCRTDSGAITHLANGGAIQCPSLTDPNVGIEAALDESGTLTFRAYKSR